MMTMYTQCFSDGSISATQVPTQTLKKAQPEALTPATHEFDYSSYISILTFSLIWFHIFKGFAFGANSA